MPAAKNERAASRSMTPKGKAKSGSRGKAPKKQEPEKENAWEYRLADTRAWGEKLRKCGGTGPPSTRPVKNLLKTLKDSRSLSEVSLRRTAVEALVPAAEIGHRGALAAQAARLTDPSDAVRHAALLSLRTAGGGQRPQPGGAVAIALAEALPPRKAVYDLDTRRRAADALMRLAPVGDQHFLATASKWAGDEDATVRLSSTQALGCIGTGQETIDLVAARLTDSDWRVSRAAMQALEQLSTGKEPPGRRASVSMGTFAFDQEAPAGGDPMRAASADSFGASGSAKPSTPAVMMTRASTSAPSCGSPPITPQNLARLAPDQESGGKNRFVLARSNTGISDSGVSRQSTVLSRRLSKAGSMASIGSASATSSRPAGSRPDSSRSRRGGSGGAGRSHSNPAVTKVLVQSCGGDPGAGSACSLLGLVRVDAVDALGRAAKPGDAAALRAVAQRLADMDAAVRDSAEKAFEALAKGDRAAAVRLSGRLLSDSDFRVRGSASRALTACAKGDRSMEDAFCIAAAALEKPDWRSRRGVGQTLQRLDETARASQDEMEVDVTMMALQSLLPRLHHTDWSVRRKAVQAIASVAEGSYGSARAVELLSLAADDADDEVMLEVARALPSAAPRRSKRAVAIAALLADAKYQEPAGKALTAGKASKSSAVSVLAISEVPDQEDAGVKKKHPLEVRLVALDALELLAGEGRSRSRAAIRAVGSLLEDPDPQVCEVAERVFCTIGSGRRTAVDFLTELLLHPDEKVRGRAARCFKVATLRMKDRALKRTMHLIRHADAGIRNAASQATAAFTASAEQESVAVAAAAAVMARFRKDRLPDPNGPTGSRTGSRAGSRAGSESGRSSMSRGSRMSRASKMSKSSKGSKRGGSKTQEQRDLLAMKAGRASSKGASEAGSKAVSVASKGSKAVSVASKGSRGTASVSSKLKLSTLLRGDSKKATTMADAQHSLLAELERAEQQRVAELEEIERMERGPREEASGGGPLSEEFSHSETDDEQDAVEEEDSEGEPDEQNQERGSQQGAPFGGTLQRAGLGSRQLSRTMSQGGASLGAASGGSRAVAE